MTARTSQPTLFDTIETPNCEPSSSATARMRATIDGLAALDTPPWKSQCDVILTDGAFKRAMRLVPKSEADHLWQEFDGQMVRLYAIWENDHLLV